MRGKWRFAALGLVLGGCIPPGHPPQGTGPASAPSGAPAVGEAIRYETGPCFGACPVYAVTVNPDGSGLFEGKRFTVVTGTRSFRATPAQVAAFAARLAPYRPINGTLRYAPGEPQCRNAITDMPSVDVQWMRGGGAGQHLTFYFGCDRERLRAMATALGNAPEALPIQDLIGARP